MQTILQFLKDTQLLGVLIGSLLTILGLILQNIHNRKTNILLSLLSSRNNAYQKVYEGLNRLRKYYDSFIYGGEFKECKDHTTFSPLHTFSEFSDLFNEYSFYLDKNTKKEINTLFSTLSIGNSMALAASSAPELVTEDSIERFCINSIRSIDTVNDVIRDNMGLNELEKIIK